MNIVIDKVFKKLFPPLLKEEYELLEQSIIKEGCREPLTLWNGILIDGHNRLAICQKCGKTYEIRNMEFESREAAIAWMISTQLGRRNLGTEQQVSYYRGLHYEMEKKVQGTNNQFVEKNEKRQNDALHKTSQKLAEKYSVSPRTIERDAKVTKVIDIIGETSPEVKAKILSGQAKDVINKKGLEKLAMKSKEEIAEAAQQIETGTFLPKTLETPTEEPETQYGKAAESVQKSETKPEPIRQKPPTLPTVEESEEKMRSSENKRTDSDNHAICVASHVDDCAESILCLLDKKYPSLKHATQKSKDKITASISNIENAVNSLKNLIGVI